jgi:hypothetical protein
MMLMWIGACVLLWAVIGFPIGSMLGRHLANRSEEP